MVIVKLMGGLGNQLFQYATAKALAERHKTELRLDLSFLQTDPKGQHTHRHFELDAFRIRAAIALNSEVQKFTNPGLFQKALSKLSLSTKKRIVENGFEYKPESRSWPGNCYLDGFWQSEKYFFQIRKTLLSDLELKKSLSEASRNLAEQIDNVMSVSLHIRRGDYIHLKSANTFHGVLPLSYYYDAITVLNAKLKKYTVFVFSDDLEWVKSNLKINAPVVYVDYQDENKTATDLVLMSMCKHNIIANSSFSWWGAWLNKNENKLVVAPNPWFRNTSVNTKDLIPGTWTQIEVNYER
ncbi:MAG: alpha-1,2-fucosyltransferase [Bacteroidia bacterium]|nr:alpha-1,2-fucosyltransferase [Bacteroidia bacterium]